MNTQVFNRLHTLRMENDAAGFAMQEMKPRFETMAGRHENGTAPRAVVAHQLFQTPADMAERLVELLDLKPGARVLEPSAGLGRLLDALKPYNPSEVVAVDVSRDCTNELGRRGDKGLVIRRCDFLTLTPEEAGTFDAVAMNPPFHMRSDIKHIQHALTFLKPGGRLAAICMAGPKREEAFKSMADEWIEVEQGAFGKEGTNVGTIMMVITKQETK